ncbi:GbsR/MarR family transcriptional regulator [Streptomyces sp. 6N223]|uniref:GbsR/MarR family transcriptional regulator n=1 Tax=Streptomyces sp. 6N223 TaxID=3457412 RepID=UPI003FD5C305
MIAHDSSQDPHGALSPQAAAFVERMAADLTEAGTQRMAARVFACLMISEEPGLTSAQLAQRLQVSPAAVSGAVRYLSMARLLRRERQPGSRREVYRLHHHVWYEAITIREEFLERWRQTMKDGMQVVTPGSPAYERLAETADFLEYVAGELTSLLDRWRDQREDGVPSGDGET